MELYYIVYTSAPAKVFDDAKMQELLVAAREANVRFDITGMLICLPDTYIQLIEGPQDRVKQLYQNIQCDQRHLRVTTLLEGPINQRFFPDWAMAFKKKDLSGNEDTIPSLQDDSVLRLFDILER